MGVLAVLSFVRSSVAGVDEAGTGTTSGTAPGSEKEADCLVQ